MFKFKFFYTFRFKYLKNTPESFFFLLRFPKSYNSLSHIQMEIKEKLQISIFSIVLIGDLNPIIFQPAWLAAKGLIRENEAESCKVELIHKELVRYKLDWAQLEITSNRFSITTAQEPYYETVRDLVIGIFKKFLKETPLTAMGLNHGLHYQLNEKQYFEFGNKFAPLNNWSDYLTNPKLLQLEILDQKRLDHRPGYYRIKVAPSDEIPSNGIVININDHYSLAEGQAGRNGEVITILEETWEYTFDLAEKITENLWKRVQ